ncbi:phage tail sheath family protein [Chitinophaga nivalis]|uniref:Phage tail sheath family protein n=1 Tax=Chitinophaga nivalis TaxID=2991709 RepID=A0ABT3IP74_9BACT|nr:phage tail sheath family protein [Chitinophaga nivalis]MCW3464562.1 phage tail sheath family protein [Chitinophaga nivalis]MCW3485747.1 phage tail sheath family protein [Chitinophaga nivalis]
MANTYYTPGVYVEEVSKFPPSITAVETAIPVFIGFTQQAVNDGKEVIGTPVRISSLLEYENIFGKAQKEENLIVTLSTDQSGTRYTVSYDTAPDKGLSRHILYYSLQQFYANGGGPCYIISVGKYLDLGFPIVDQEPFTDALTELRKLDEPTLIIFPEGQNMPKDTYQSLLEAALKQCFELKDRFVIMDLFDNGLTLKTEAAILEAANEFRNKISSPQQHLSYGAVYFPNIRSTFDYDYDETKIKIVNGSAATFPGLNNLEKANVKLAISNFSIILPPSSAVAGVYARVDNARGVWKAPANEGLLSVSGVTCDISDSIQANLNVDTNAGKSVNAIRFFSGKGIKIWGARTLDGNSNEWRYVSVRRYFNMVEESTKKASEGFVFEPNDANTWVKVKAMIENFLINQWRAGALAGAKPEHAFYVKIGINETMTAFDILEGRMIVEIGLAVVRPAEFIILRFSHKMQES